LIQKVFVGKLDGRRKSGRPNLSGFGCIENHLKSMGVKRCRKKAEDRSVWAIFVKSHWLHYKDLMQIRRSITVT
jgi:hypothetical protein